MQLSYWYHYLLHSLLLLVDSPQISLNWQNLDKESSRHFASNVSNKFEINSLAWTCAILGAQFLRRCLSQSYLLRYYRQQAETNHLKLTHSLFNWNSIVFGRAWDTFWGTFFGLIYRGLLHRQLFYKSIKSQVLLLFILYSDWANAAKSA